MATVGKDFPEGFEVVIPCLLDGDKMQDALDLLALGGRIVMYGACGCCFSAGPKPLARRVRARQLAGGGGGGGGRRAHRHVRLHRHVQGV